MVRLQHVAVDTEAAASALFRLAEVRAAAARVMLAVGKTLRLACGRASAPSTIRRIVDRRSNGRGAGMGDLHPLRETLSATSPLLRQHLLGQKLFAIGFALV